MKKLPAPMLTIALTLALTSSPTAAAAPSPLEGLWSNPNRSVVVRIGPCGEQLCGRVVSASPKARDKAAQGGRTPTPRATFGSPAHSSPCTGACLV
jgi:uncharacterized protein (DUF2147 family)